MGAEGTHFARFSISQILKGSAHSAVEDNPHFAIPL